MDTHAEYKANFGAPTYITVPVFIIPQTMFGLDFDKMAAEVHKGNLKWWRDLRTGVPLDRNKNELIMLMVTEVAEACEGERKSKPNKPKMDDKVVHRRMAEVEVADIVIRALDFAGGFGIRFTFDPEPNLRHDPLPENRADALLTITKRLVLLSNIANGDDAVLISQRYSRVIITCFEYCEKFGYDLMGAYADKNAYNLTRKDHSVEARLEAGGKEF